MPRRSLPLTEVQRASLIQARATAPRPWQRERATAMLKIADGMPPAAVARHGLLKPRDPDTVYTWLANYLAADLPGLLFIRPGRGRKPAFFPCAPGRPPGPGAPAADGAAGPRDLRAAGSALDPGAPPSGSGLAAAAHVRRTLAPLPPARRELAARARSCPQPGPL